MDLKTIGLLGTKYTMEQDFYKGRLLTHGLQVITPDECNRTEVNRIIYDELCLGVIKEHSRQKYNEIIQELVGRGAEGVILGCTEIGLLISGEELNIPIFDTTYLHAKSAIDLALKEKSFLD